MTEAAGSSKTQIPIYQMTQHHITEVRSPESEELLHTITLRPGRVPKSNDYHIISHYKGKEG
jgi:hypothetical protein